MSDYIKDFMPIGRTIDELTEFLLGVQGMYDEHYGSWYQEWDEKDGEITVDIRTGGWSDNEAVVEELLGNRMIRLCCYYAWERGGKHVFKFTAAEP